MHQLFLDGKLVWRMKNPDSRKLVNNHEHGAHFSVFSRLKRFVRYSADDAGALNSKSFGSFFGQIGGIRISDVRRY